MQKKVIAKDKKRFNLNAVIIILVVIIAGIAIAIAAANYWDSSTVDRSHLRKQLSDLNGKHHALSDEHGKLSKQQENKPVANTVAPIETPQIVNDKKSFDKLQQIYAMIDTLPGRANSKVGSKKVHSSQMKKQTKTDDKNGFAEDMVNELKSIVTVKKRDRASKSTNISNIEISKIELKILVNEMRWSLLNKDFDAFHNSSKKAQSILMKKFASNDAQVQQMATMFESLTSAQDDTGVEL